MEEGTNRLWNLDSPMGDDVWAFVTAGISTTAVLQLVEQEVQQRGVACFKSQELANLVWAFAKADKSSYDMNAFAIFVEVLVLRFKGTIVILINDAVIVVIIFRTTIIIFEPITVFGLIRALVRFV